MCSHLEWEPNIDSSMLANFEHSVALNFSKGRPSYPNYEFEIAMVSKHAVHIIAIRLSTLSPCHKSWCDVIICQWVTQRVAILQPFQTLCRQSVN